MEPLVGLVELGGDVEALAVLNNGDVVAGGNFTTAGGTSVNSIARWSASGNTWSAMGSGITGGARHVNAMKVLPGGDLLIGGDFTTAGGVSVADVARWNPTTGAWSALSTGLSGPATSFAVLPSGDTYVTGGFQTAGGIGASNIARWNLTTSVWSSLSPGIDGAINALSVIPGPSAPGTASLIAGGTITGAGGAPAGNVARWNSSTSAWFPLGSGTTGEVRAVLALFGGDAIVGGGLTSAGGLPASNIARWRTNTAAWEPLGAGIGPSTGRVNALAALPSGDIIVGGGFISAGSQQAMNVARWSPATQTWSALGAGVNDVVYALTVLPGTDELVVAGSFAGAGGAPAAGIAFWHPSLQSWSPLGSGVNFNVYALTALPNGDVYAGGDFTTAGGISVASIAKWSSTTHTWSALGSGVNGYVYALATQQGPSGLDLIVSGSFISAGIIGANNIARWRPATSAWSALGSGLSGGAARALAVLPLGGAGDIAVGGNFTTAGGNTSPAFARWSARPTCAADFNCSGAATIEDLFSFLAAWFASDVSANFNGVGSVTVQDLFDFLTAWFAGC